MDRDLYYLHKALLLAKKGIYSVNPNPAVGAIVVKNEKIIGMGYHCLLYTSPSPRDPE